MENFSIHDDIGGEAGGSSGNGQQMLRPPINMFLDMGPGMPRQGAMQQGGPLAQRSGGGNGALGGGNGNGNGGDIGGGNGGGIPQLPPQMFTTAASLLDLTDSMFCQFFVVSTFLQKEITMHGSWLRDGNRN